jgi:ribosomal protein S10
MFFYLKISCKDKKILKNFLRFFAKLDSLLVFLKSLPKHKKRKFVTVLKSPHVNKTAQEQFEYRLYSKHFLIHSFKPLTFFLFLKKLKNLSFSGINLKVKGFLEKNKMQKHVLRVVSPDNIILKSVADSYLGKKRLKKFQHKKTLKQISKNHNSDFLFYKKYVQLFDLYGEICLKKIFYS